MPARADGAGSAPGLIGRLSVGQLMALIALGPLIVLVVSLIAGISTVSHQSSVRRALLGRIEPAARDALLLQTAMLNQETGIRGYELTGQRAFLQPYELGLTQEAGEAKRLAAARIEGVNRPLFIALIRIHAWQNLTAVPAVRTGGVGRGSTRTVDTAAAGKAQFDAIRTALASLETAISRRVRTVQGELDSSAHATQITLATIGVLLLITVLATAIALRRLVSRPLGRVTDAARRVAGGDLAHAVTLAGPQDIAQMAADVDAMRRRLLAELEAATSARNELAMTAGELERSNHELEQFAYVASHDLQEPLRKVTSFCQMLQSRYGGQLDERADQYIAFAVDGAMRMQQLINDLLAFSRVGRSRARRRPVDLTELARRAAHDLDQAARDADGVITIDSLPTLPVDSSLMYAVFQNLIGNALKFRGEAPPRIHVGVRRETDAWRFSCTDNGIGIESEYAERVFAIFQRLHTRDRYPGTGIGLAMCRKIIEDHGGRVWLDTDYSGGTRVFFSLPLDTGEGLSDSMPVT